MGAGKREFVAWEVRWSGSQGGMSSAPTAFTCTALGDTCGTPAGPRPSQAAPPPAARLALRRALEMRPDRMNGG